MATYNFAAVPGYGMQPQAGVYNTAQAAAYAQQAAAQQAAAQAAAAQQAALATAAGAAGQQGFYAQQGATVVMAATRPANGKANEGVAEAARRALCPSERVDLVAYRALLPERFEVDVEQCYKMGSKLGEGGYGSVCIAKDRQYEGRSVAIKKVTKKSPKHVEAFHREARVMRELDHPNICRLYEVFENPKHMFFVMEVCCGGELFDRIIQEKRISESSSAGVLCQVVRALSYAHSRGVAHRDLKPENVCYCSKGGEDVKVIDWGLSALFAEQAMNSAAGTLLYMAPEVAAQRERATERKPYGSACDVWSLGVLAYVMLCGRPPFWGEKTLMIRKIKAADYPMNFEPWTNIVSAAAKDFVNTMLQPDPEQRPSSADALSHRWLSDWEYAQGACSDPKASAAVLTNLQRFSRLSLFRAICITAIAQQLEQRHLEHLDRAFRELDTSGDGVLSLEEVRIGFQKALGPDCPEASHIEELFRAADLDGSGAIDYTEFCAAGLGERESLQDDALWAAFRSLDREVDGKLSADDLTSILAEADVQRTFSMSTCGDVAREVVRKWDRNSDGGIDFDEFRALMQATEKATASNAAPGAAPLPSLQSSVSNASLGGTGERSRSRSPRRMRRNEQESEDTLQP